MIRDQNTYCLIADVNGIATKKLRARIVP